MIKKLFGKKEDTVKLTTRDLVAQAQGKVASALEMFSTLHNEIEEANEVLRQVQKEDLEAIKLLQNNYNKASDELSMNLALQQKLSENFLVKKGK